MKEELFDLEINDEGIHWFEKLQKFGRIVLIATIFTTVFGLCKNVPLLIELDNTPSAMELKWKVLNKLFVYSSLADIILLLAAAINYYRFAETVKKAISEKNSELLNQSFRFIYWIVLIFLIELCIIFVSFMYGFLVKLL